MQLSLLSLVTEYGKEIPSVGPTRGSPISQTF